MYGTVVSPEESAVCVIRDDFSVVRTVLEYGCIGKGCDTSRTRTCCRDEVTIVDASCHRTACSDVAGDISKTSAALLRECVELVSVVDAVAQLNVPVAGCHDT